MIRTGKDGYVNGIPCISRWGINRQTSASRYAASCTLNGGTAVTDGNINVTGMMSGIGGDPPLVWGADMAFAGAVDAFGSGGSDPIAFEGDIRINELTITIPKEAGTEITWEAAFGVQGDVEATDTSYIDATNNEHRGAAIAANAMFGPAAPYTYAEIDGFRGARLTIRRPEKTFVLNGLTYRDSGNFEAEAVVDVYSDNILAAQNALNQVGKLKLFIDATTHWEFNYMKISELSGFVMNRATQDLVGYSINYMWTAVNTTTAGHIKRPNGTMLIGV